MLQTYFKFSYINYKCFTVLFKFNKDKERHCLFKILSL